MDCEMLKGRWEPVKYNTNMAPENIRGKDSMAYPLSREILLK